MEGGTFRRCGLHGNHIFHAHKGIQGYDDNDSRAEAMDQRQHPSHTLGMSCRIHYPYAIALFP